MHEAFIPSAYKDTISLGRPKGSEVYSYDSLRNDIQLNDIKHSDIQHNI